jgi:hypothetical protein
MRMSEPPAGIYNARLSFGERVVSIQGLVGSVAAGVVLAIALSASGRADQQTYQPKDSSRVGRMAIQA